MLSKISFPTVGSPKLKISTLQLTTKQTNILIFNRGNNITTFQDSRGLIHHK